MVIFNGIMLPTNSIPTVVSDLLSDTRVSENMKSQLRYWSEAVRTSYTQYESSSGVDRETWENQNVSFYKSLYRVIESAQAELAVSAFIAPKVSTGMIDNAFDTLAYGTGARRAAHEIEEHPTGPAPPQDTAGLPAYLEAIHSDRTAAEVIRAAAGISNPLDAFGPITLDDSLVKADTPSNAADPPSFAETLATGKFDSTEKIHPGTGLPIPDHSSSVYDPVVSVTKAGNVIHLSDVFTAEVKEKKSAGKQPQPGLGELAFAAAVIWIMFL